MVIEGGQIILQDNLHELLGFENMLLKDVVDSDYKYVEQRRAESSKMLRSEDEEDDDEDEEDDPEYRLILQNLKEHDLTYRIEYEEDGSRAFIKYEGASGSDTECDEEPREKPRKQKDGPSNQMPRADNRPILDSHYTPSRGMKMLSSRQTRSKSKGERQENAKSLAKHKVPVPVPVPVPQYRRKLRSATEQVDAHLIRVRDADSRPTPMTVMAKLARKNSQNESIKKLRSATEQADAHLIRVRDADSRPTPMTVMAKLTRKNSQNESSEKEENVVKLDSVCHTSRKPERLSMKSMSESDDEIIQLDTDYHIFSKNLIIVNGCYVGMIEGAKVVYEEKSGDGIKMKDDDDGGGGGGDSDSDLEIIDKAAFDKKIKGSNSNNRNAMKHSEFRHKVIAALKKPFDRKEYKKLLQLIKLHKIKERHMDLRGGRERPFGTQEYGKSYLDHHPDLKKLLDEEDNLPKRLNLLRGYFLWIEHSGVFCPWKDDECLAVRPRLH